MVECDKDPHAAINLIRSMKVKDCLPSWMGMGMGGGSSWKRIFPHKNDLNQLVALKLFIIKHC